MVVFVGDGSYLRSPSVVCVAEEGERGGVSPDSGRAVGGVCVVCSPYEGARSCRKDSGGSREGVGRRGREGIVYIMLRARERAWLYGREI